MASTIKSFEIEFQPFIKDIHDKEQTIREYADAATMERVRGMLLLPSPLFFPFHLHIV